jgi:valyl-tRNA synthetase
MTGISKIQKVSSGKGLHLTRSRHEAWIDVEEQKATEYINKLIKRREGLESEISKLESRLSNKSYTKNAPSKIVQQTKDNLTEQQELAEKISLEIQTFEHAIKMS